MEDSQWKVEKGPQASYQADVLERTYFDQHQAKARLRHEPRLNSPAGAYKQNFRLVARLQFARNGQRRNYVSASSTPGDDHPHNPVSLR